MSQNQPLQRHMLANFCIKPNFHFFSLYHAISVITSQLDVSKESKNILQLMKSALKGPWQRANNSDF